MPIRQWHIGPTWAGEDAFIVCGGTSVKPEEVQLLRGRARSKVIVINSSYLIAPWADILFFGDDRWWRNEIAARPEALESFAGQCVTIGRHVRHPSLWYMNKMVPIRSRGLTREPNALCMERTSLQGALNICLHKAVRRIILIGADNKEGPSGRVHHHAEYPWEPAARKPGTWDGKAEQLSWAVPILAGAGIEVLNASPISTFPWWPKIDLMKFLNATEARNAKG